MTTRSRVEELGELLLAELDLVAAAHAADSSRGPERAPVGGRAGRGRAAEVVAQRGGGAEAGAPGDLVDRQVGLLEQAAGLEHPLGEQPLQRRGPGLLAEAAGEGARADRGVAGHRGDVERLGRAAPAPRGASARATPAGPRGRRTLGGPRDELGLAALAVRRRHHPAGDLGPDGGAEVGADHVQGEVEAGADPGRGHHIALVDVEHGGVDLDPREARRELGCERPVGGRPPAVEQARVGERKGPGADRDRAGAAAVGAAQGLQRLSRRRVEDPPVGGDDDRVRGLEGGEVPLGDDREAAPRADCSARGRAGRELIERLPVGPAGGREGVRGIGEVEGDDPVEAESDHAVHGRAVWQKPIEHWHSCLWTKPSSVGDHRRHENSHPHLRETDRPRRDRPLRGAALGPRLGGEVRRPREGSRAHRLRRISG